MLSHVSNILTFSVYSSENSATDIFNLLATNIEDLFEVDTSLLGQVGYMTMIRIQHLRVFYVTSTTEVDSKKEAQAQVVAYLKHLSDMIPIIPVMADKAVAPKQRCGPLSSRIAW